MPSDISGADSGPSYSPWVGLIYIFNLIVGTGALAIPQAFYNAGYVYSFAAILVLAFMSFVTVTHIIEAMSATNAYSIWMNEQRLRQGSSVNTDEIRARLDTLASVNNPDYNTATNIQESDEKTPLLLPERKSVVIRSGLDAGVFSIRQQFEMGHMASLYFNKVGEVFFYLCITVYLYGDLAIYAAAVPKSLRDVICFYNVTSCYAFDDLVPCWSDKINVSRRVGYHLCLGLFAFTLGPFLFFNVQKTKVLQITTTVLRWLAFLTMIVLASKKLLQYEGRGNPPIGNVSKLPNFFGACVYSFMCHHSLPSLTTPIRNKSNLLKLFAADYSLILIFYLVLCFTAIFAYENIPDLYSLNFRPFCTGDYDGSGFDISLIFDYYLALFPVFTLATTFPIIGITLRNNLHTLFYREGRCHWLVAKLLFPLMSLIPPLAVAFVTDNVEILVSMTGSYAGVGVQYVVPACLVFYSRRTLVGKYDSEVLVKSVHRSPFGSNFWVLLVLTWAALCVVLVTVNHVIHGF